jgi:lactoylglutathione lyase
MKVKYNTMIVKDMDESVKFYTDILGLEIDSEYDLPQAKITLIKSEGESMIELIQNKVNEIGLYSVGIEVEDLNSEVERLKEKGIKFLLEPTKITVGTMALLQDPNEINIVLIQHN